MAVQKINCVLLVDDNPATNFLNRKVIENTKLANTINIATNGIEALDYIHSRGKFSTKKYPKANIIFLDINMPKMGGFEFLENYENLDSNLKADIVVVFLTTSNWVKDKMEAKNNEFIFDFIEKPLSENKFQEIYKYYIENKI